MKKIILSGILNIYYADGQSGDIYCNDKKLKTIWEDGRKEPRVQIKRTEGGYRKYAKGYLVIGAYEGFRDRKLYRYSFINGDMTDTRSRNLEWVQRYGFIDFFTDEEYRLFHQKIEQISNEAGIKFNNYLDYRIKTKKGLAGYSKKEREKFIKNLLDVKINKIKSVREAKDLSFIRMSKNKKI